MRGHCVYQYGCPTQGGTRTLPFPLSQMTGRGAEQPNSWEILVSNGGASNDGAQFL